LGFKGFGFFIPQSAIRIPQLKEFIVARSIHKGPYVDPNLMQKVQEAVDANSRKVIKTWSRRSTVLPDMVGLTFAVHNGKKFIPVFVTENMVGHKLGEFSPTRAFFSHSGDRKTKVKATTTAAPAPAKPAA
jgi:small subunit ribosomal protein S19